jgi:pimeloyl-ACP methyl ester carboxylesterase
MLKFALLQRRVAVVSMSAALLGGASAFSAPATKPVTVPLVSSVASSALPTCVLVHGLDSSKETFAGVAAELAAAGYPAICFDLRGHGESPLGDPEEFGPEALASDVLAAARQQCGRCVLVGHSMGGRVAMRVAALDAKSDAPLCAAVVIEDMDTRVRERASPLADEAQRAALAKFAPLEGRRFPTFEAAKAALLPWFDGDAARIDGYKGKRIRRQPDGSFHSDLNPLAQRLARDRVLATDDGHQAWQDLAAAATPASAPLHVWVADTPGTVCALDGCEGSIEDMKRLHPSAHFKAFPNSGHSIHNTAREAFMTALKEVIDDAARNEQARAKTRGVSVRGG